MDQQAAWKTMYIPIRLLMRQADRGPHCFQNGACSSSTGQWLVQHLSINLVIEYILKWNWNGENGKSSSHLSFIDLSFYTEIHWITSTSFHCRTKIIPIIFECYVTHGLQCTCIFNLYLVQSITGFSTPRVHM